MRCIASGARPPDLSLRGGRRPTWQSRGTCRIIGKPSAKSQLPSRDCTPRALPRASRSGRHVGLWPPRNDKLGGVAPMNLCRKYCHPAGRSLSAIGSCRYCSSDSVAQGSRICHCEAPKGPWQSRKGSCVFADGFPVIWSGTARLPRAQSALAMTNRGQSPF